MKRFIVLILFFPTLLSAKLVSISNRYVMVGVDDLTGRFYMTTTEGDPDFTSDDYQTLLDKSYPFSTVAVLKLDDLVTTYGSYDGYFAQRPIVEDDRIISEWKIRGVEFIQVVELVQGITTGRKDTVRLSFVIFNFSGWDKNIGVEMIFDAFLGERDGVPFTLPDGTVVKKELVLTGDKIPPYWFGYDQIENPTLRIQGTLIHPRVVRPDKVAFSQWTKLYDEQWDFEPGDVVFPDDPRFDTAVGIFYEPRLVKNGNSAFFSTMYGLFGANIESNPEIAVSLSCKRVVEKPSFPVLLELENKSSKAINQIEIKPVMPDGFAIRTAKSSPIRILSPGERLTLNYQVESDLQFDRPYNLNVDFELTGKSGGQPTELKVSRPVTIDSRADTSPDFVRELHEQAQQVKTLVAKQNTVGAVKKEVSVTELVDTVQEKVAEQAEDVEMVYTNLPDVTEIRETNIIAVSTPATNVVAADQLPETIPVAVPSQRTAEENFYLGLAYHIESNYTAALDYFLKTKELDPYYKHLYFYIGTAYLKTGNLDSAETNLLQALAMQPSFPEVMVNLGNIAYRRGEIEKALDYYQRALALDPENINALYDRGRIYLQTGKYQEAVNDFTGAINRNFYFVPGYVQRRQAYLKLKLSKKAEHDRRILETLGYSE